MPLDIVIGAQWGDEGKGRIVDVLARDAQIVARYNGGDNAGHTVTVGPQTFRLHLIPSGVINPDTKVVLGGGMVINPETLLQEMETLGAMGVDISPKRVRISYAAHVITPAHKALDRVQEAARGKVSLGTTLRGIGPAYVDKVARRGLRLRDMLDADTFAEAVRAHVQNTNEILTQLYKSEPLPAETISKTFRDYARRLQPYIDDISSLVADSLAKDQKVLAEGAQGTLLDLEHGTYPYVTSSIPTVAGAICGLGVGVGAVRRVVGVTKAFQTRVGAGPFPTELNGSTAMALRGTGENPWDEFGTTTGRPRRVGWLDAVLLRYAVQVNGFTELALTKLDILSGLQPVCICIGYRRGGEVFNKLPFGLANLESLEPVYKQLTGWKDDIRSVRRLKDLPDQALEYIEHIETLSGVPIRMVSVGPEREQIIIDESTQ
ncbi:MAG: adenylosuccinate synthase [Chloroflexota bacterium]